MKSDTCMCRIVQTAVKLETKVRSSAEPNRAYIATSNDVLRAAHSSPLRSTFTKVALGFRPADLLLHSASAFSEQELTGDGRRTAEKGHRTERSFVFRKFSEAAVKVYALDVGRAAGAAQLSDPSA